MKLFINFIASIAVTSWLYFYYVVFTTYSDSIFILAGLCLLITAVHSLLYKRYLNEKKWKM